MQPYEDAASHPEQPEGTQTTPAAEPTWLYHFTTIEGLTGILESKTIWASDVSFMNDTSEYKYSEAVIHRVLQSLRNTHDYEMPTEAILDQVTRGRREVYAACFCARVDLLSMWRAYSKNGLGYAIEIDRAMLDAICHLQDPPVTLQMVEYDPAKQEQTIRPMLEDLSPLFEHKPSAADRAVRALVSLPTARAFLKAPVFHEEQEWRAAIVRAGGDSGDGVRPSNGLLVPYRKIPIEYQFTPPCMPISRIIVGPGSRTAQAKRGVLALLRNLALSSTMEVDGDETPVLLD